MFFILGFVIFLFSTWFLLVVLGGNITFYLNVPFFVFGSLMPLLAVLTAMKSFKVFYRGLKAVILPHAPITEELRGQAASLFRLLSKLTAIMMAIGFLISTINILSGLNPDDPNAYKAISGNIAYALVNIIYGLFPIAAIYEPVVFNLKKRRDVEHTERKDLKYLKK